MLSVAKLRYSMSLYHVVTEKGIGDGNIELDLSSAEQGHLDI